MQENLSAAEALPGPHQESLQHDPSAAPSPKPHRAPCLSGLGSLLTPQFIFDNLHHDMH